MIKILYIFASGRYVSLGICLNKVVVLNIDNDPLHLNKIIDHENYTYAERCPSMGTPELRQNAPDCNDWFKDVVHRNSAGDAKLVYIEITFCYGTPLLQRLVFIVCVKLYFLLFNS